MRIPDHIPLDQARKISDEIMRREDERYGQAYSDSLNRAANEILTGIEVTPEEHGEVERLKEIYREYALADGHDLPSLEATKAAKAVMEYVEKLRAEKTGK